MKWRYLAAVGATTGLCAATLGGLTAGGLTFASTRQVTYSACLAAGLLSHVTIDGTPKCADHVRVVTWNEQGQKGTPGPKGTPGTSILHGTTAPTSTQGSTGDFYLDTSSEVLYGPKATGAWPATGTSLVGPKGTTGPQGPKGTTGPQGPKGTTGPQGPPGAVGYVVKSKTVSLGPDSVLREGVACPTGDVPTGGGIYNGFYDKPDSTLVVNESFPFVTSATSYWFTTVTNHSSTTTFTVHWYAVCISSS